MKRDTWIQLIALIVMVGCLAVSGGLAVGLTSSGGRHKLGYADTDVEGQPPQVAVGIAMGAFRGLFVNFLWIRANNLKEDGRFYESMDLARAITKLQPRYPQVWVFHAWNMAYNISVQTQTEAERWNWVQSGIKLMRDQGLPANPNDLLMHKELGWLFLHKIGGYMDEANMYYKKRLALEWTNVLGPPPAPDFRNRDRRKLSDKYADWIRPIAESPDTLDQVIAREPSVHILVDRLKAEAGYEPDWKIAQNYVAMRAIMASSERKVFERSKAFDARKRAVESLVEDPAMAKAWPPLLAYIRRRWVIDEYHMEPERMLRYTEMYGPIDWRHFAAHGLYWSQLGVENALERVTRANKADFDFINSGRVAVQSLQELWRSGDLWFDYLSYLKTGDDRNVNYRASPNAAFIDSYREHLEWFKSLSWADNPRRVYSFYAAGYDNLMMDAIRFFYRRGQVALATKYKDDLGTWVGQNTNDSERNVKLAMPIEEFVKEELKDEALKRPSVMREECIGALQGAFVNGLLVGDNEVFNQQFRYAKWVHEYFFHTQGILTQVSRESGGRMAQLNPRFEIVAGEEFANIVAILDPDDAERVYDGAPNDLKLWGYDLLASRYKEYMDDLAKTKDGRPFDQVFPKPDRLDEHRAMIQKLIEDARNAPTVEQK